MITFKAKTVTGEIINSKLSPFSFPAGEAHTKIEERREFEPTEIAILQPSATSLHDDLFQLAMWANTLDHVNTTMLRTGPDVYIKRIVVLPYMPGARADRGVPFGLEVYAEFLKVIVVPDQVILFDPHSDATVEALGSSWVDITVLGSDILAVALPKFYMGVIAPDKGAESRAKTFADVLGIPVFTVEKERDFETGKLLGFKVPELDRDGRYLIVDDIVDGGGTFTGIADALELPQGHLDLYVSHGVFSKGTDLGGKFGKIYTTNSYQGPREGVNVFDIIRPMLNTIK